VCARACVWRWRAASHTTAMGGAADRGADRTLLPAVRGLRIGQVMPPVFFFLVGYEILQGGLFLADEILQVPPRPRALPLPARGGGAAVLAAAPGSASRQQGRVTGPLPPSLSLSLAPMHSYAAHALTHACARNRGMTGAAQGPTLLLVAPRAITHVWHWDVTPPGTWASTEIPPSFRARRGLGQRVRLPVWLAGLR
jgi:hypothetical protein